MTSEPTVGAAVSQHRALVFCQYKSMLDIIERDLFKSVSPLADSYDIFILSGFIDQGTYVNSDLPSTGWFNTSCKQI